jgi:hypothetical protein
MAKCRECGTNVGCGCQLINGLCGFCHGKLKQTFKHVITQAYKLYRMY